MKTRKVVKVGACDGRVYYAYDLALIKQYFELIGALAVTITDNQKISVSDSGFSYNGIELKEVARGVFTKMEVVK